MVGSFTPGITVCIPSIPPRQALYARALESVMHSARCLPRGIPVQISTSIDDDRKGAAVNRQRALEAVTTEWTAFLDDDDTMDPSHLRELFFAAHEHEADYLWSRFRIGFPGGQFRDGPSPLGAGTFDQWNDDQPAQTTITTLVRTELALDVGGFTGKLCRCVNCGGHDPDEPCQGPPGEIDGQRAGEDWLFTLACRAAGGEFRHVPKVTWTWYHHGANTSGLPSRW